MRLLFFILGYIIIIIMGKGQVTPQNKNRNKQTNTKNKGANQQWVAKEKRALTHPVTTI